MEAQDSAPPVPPRRRSRRSDPEYQPVTWHVMKVYFSIGETKVYRLSESNAHHVMKEFAEGDGGAIPFEHTMGYAVISPDFVTLIEAEEMKGEA